MNATICTIIAKNYLAQARCLAESFYAQHPDGRMVVLLIDQPDDCFDPRDEPFTIVLMSELAIPSVAQMAFRYTVLELSTAVKPFFIEYLFDHADLEHLIYLDPDIYCYRPLTPLLEALQTHMLALTPHLLEPLDDQYRPNELDILRVGVYNLGCIGLARSPDLRTFLRWWQRRLERDCVVDLSRGLFVDQGWIDLAPSLFGGVAIVRDPGCNVAYWNLAQRHLTASAGGWLVNGRPLLFYHFSGLSIEDIEQISIHQNRYTLAQLPELRPLFKHYHGRLKAHGHAAARRWPYSFSQFDNGVSIPDLARQLWRATDGERRWAAPFEAAGSGSFLEWLNQEADQSAADGLLLSNLAMEIYRQRADLQQAFPDVLGAHRRPFIEWFLHEAAQQHQIDQALIHPLRRGIASPEIARPAPTRAALLATIAVRWPLAAALRRGRHSPLPEAPLVGAPSLSRRLYYSIRNPLRRLGLHKPIKRLIGRNTVTRIQSAMVLRPAQAALPTRLIQSCTPVFTTLPRPARGLNLVGYLEHATGVGEVARALLRALEVAGYPVVGIETPADDSLRPGAQAGPYTCNLLCVNADMTPHVQRSLGTAFFQQRYTISFWHWESSSFPQEWHDRFALLDELWVASDFVRDTLAPLVSIPVRKMRIPIAIAAPAVVCRADLGLPDDRFIWLFAFDMHSYVARKNPHAAIEAYRRAFGPRARRTQLVIKASHLEAYPDQAARLSADLESVGGALIGSTMDRSKLSMLFAACDGYLSLHRCEGFGLTMAEAMALGKPVVATGYSGNMDFMTAANSYPVRHRLIELDRNHGPYRRGTHWADPDLDHAAELMRQVFEQRGAARQKGITAAADIARWHGSLSAGQGLIERLQSIESGI
ncbi:MAG: glycosyltransferase family 4 protein [Kouleothrix sp.]|nr:glycosyltransferase family 4 protein [Kouleothrix sp.]